MDWIVTGIVAVGTLWLASRVLPQSGEVADHCERCGARLEVTDQGVELMRLGLVGVLPATCPGCGSKGQLEVGAFGDDPWAR